METDMEIVMAEVTVNNNKTISIQIFIQSFL